MINASEKHPPFFIVGSGRSGSTLLRVILSAHSKVTIPPETYFIMPLVNQLPEDSSLDNEQVSRATDIILNHYRWPDMGISQEYLENTVARLQKPMLRDIMNVIYEYHLGRENKTIWGDKTPPYISILPQIKKLYPNAKLIHLIRDGRDVTKSFQATGWLGPWLHNNTTEWKESILHYENCIRNHPEIDIYEVKYENLVLQTQETVRELCDYLEIDFEPDMLSWEDTVGDKIPSREAHIHGKLNRKPAASDINRWKSEMSVREVLVTESFISRELKSAGYELCFSSPAWNILFYGTRLYCTVVLPIYSFVIRVLKFIRKKLVKNRVFSR